MRINDAVSDSGAGTIIFRTNSGETVFNENGNDVNFRIEGDTNANLFKIDAGQNNIGINVSTPNPDVILDITSTDKAVLLPRMGATPASAITAADGMILYVTGTNATFTSVGFWGYENGAWVKL